MVDCGVTCAKYSVFFFNLLFALSGIAVVTAGATIYTAYAHYHTFLGDELWSAPVVMMVVGSIVFIIAFLGCCGAIKESSCMDLTFSLLLLVIILLEIGVGAFSYANKGELDNALDRGFNKTLENYKVNEEVWNMVQTEVKCCFVNGPEDIPKVTGTDILPHSCCLTLPASTPCKVDNATKRGCKESLLNLLESKYLYFAAVAIAVAIAVALVQIIGFGYACCLYRAFRRNYEAV